MYGRRITVVVSIFIAATVIATAGVGLSSGPRPDPSASPRPAETPAASTPSSRSGCAPPSARRLASRLFSWDSAAESRQTLLRRIVTSGDDSGRETPGLLADLGQYVPEEDVWDELAIYRTSQMLRVVSLTTPSTWRDREAALHARLGAGTTAFTVRGVRTRSGFLPAAVATSSSDPVTFTMFVRCSRGASAYRLLRLSQLDHPLP